jgi:hypothetical protein
MKKEKKRGKWANLEGDYRALFGWAFSLGIVETSSDGDFDAVSELAFQGTHHTIQPSFSLLVSNYFRLFVVESLHLQKIIRSTRGITTPRTTKH